MRDDHMIGALGNEIYARGIKDAAVDSRYSIIHVDEKLLDPDNNDLLGYSGMYVGSGPVATAGDPAKLLLTDSAREALQGDKLFPESVDVNADFVPHAPASDVEARVIAVRSHTVMGQYQVVALNRGTKHGLEPGHVLASIRRAMSCATAIRKAASAPARPRPWSAAKVQLPDERAGIVMVFKSLDAHELRAGHGDDARDPQGDLARNP